MAIEAKAVWIGNDHGRYDLKVRVVAPPKEMVLEVNGVGSHSTELVRYPYCAGKVATAVCRGESQRGILIRSAGTGMSIIANKYRGIQASVCTSAYMDKMTRAHNNSNTLSLRGMIMGIPGAIDIVDSWLTTSDKGDRHGISLGLIAEAEGTLCVPVE